jgi:hypothetical protein
MVEHVPNTHKVVGSIPTGNILFFFYFLPVVAFRVVVLLSLVVCGVVFGSLWHPVFVSHTIVLVLELLLLELLLEVVVCFRSANHAYRLLLASRCRLRLLLAGYDDSRMIPSATQNTIIRQPLHRSSTCCCVHLFGLL